jgi:hypothetical protein
MFATFSRKDGSPVLVNPRMVDTVMPGPVDSQSGEIAGHSVIAFGGKDVIVNGHYEDVAETLGAALLDVYRKKAEAAAPGKKKPAPEAGRPAPEAENNL